MKIRDQFEFNEVITVCVTGVEAATSLQPVGTATPAPHHRDASHYEEWQDNPLITNRYRVKLVPNTLSKNTQWLRPTRRRGDE